MSKLSVNEKKDLLAQAVNVFLGDAILAKAVTAEQNLYRDVRPKNAAITLRDHSHHQNHMWKAFEALNPLNIFDESTYGRKADLMLREGITLDDALRITLEATRAKLDQQTACVIELWRKSSLGPKPLTKAQLDDMIIEGKIFSGELKDKATAKIT